MSEAVISGSFADYRLVKSRSVLQLVIEIAVEQQESAFRALGYPMPGTEIPVAVARLTASPQPERMGLGTASNTDTSPKQRRPFHTLPLSQQAALLCNDVAFQNWARDNMDGPHRDPDPAIDEKTAAFFMRHMCCEGLSRSTLDTNPEYAKRFLAMLERFEIAVGRRVEPR